MPNTVDILYNIKKGDFLVSTEVIFKVTSIKSGIYILDRVWNNKAYYNEKLIWSRNDMRQRCAEGLFRWVPKAKKSTIEVLFT